MKYIAFNILYLSLPFQSEADLTSKFFVDFDTINHSTLTGMRTELGLGRKERGDYYKGYNELLKTRILSRHERFEYLATLFGVLPRTVKEWFESQ